VRLYINGDAEDIMVGRTLLPLVNYEATQPRGADAVDISRLHAEPKRLHQKRKSTSINDVRNKKIDMALPKPWCGSMVEPMEELIESWCPLEFGPNGLQAPSEVSSNPAPNRWKSAIREVRTKSDSISEAVQRVSRSISSSHEQQTTRTSSGAQHMNSTRSTKSTFYNIGQRVRSNSTSAKGLAGGEVHVFMLAHKPEKKRKKTVKERCDSTGNDTPASIDKGGGMLEKVLALRNQDKEPTGSPPSPEVLVPSTEVDSMPTGPTKYAIEVESKQPEAVL